MRNKRFYVAAACALTAAFLLGLSGAVALADRDAGEVAGGDRLVGMLVTREHLDLFDAEAYFKDHADELLNGGMIGENSAYQGRLYARLIEEFYTDADGREHTSKRYTFEGVCEGIALFYADMSDEAGSYMATYGDEGISDGASSLNVTDEGRDIKLEGVIYVLPSRAGVTRYFNPVYQASDGSVYVQAGSGMSTDGFMDEGGAYTHTVSAAQTATENGVTKTDSVSVGISVRTMFEPVRIRIAQFDEQNALLFAAEYAPGALPESIRPVPGAQYLIVETFKKDPEGEEIVSRALYTKESDSLEAFFARADGVCVAQSSALDWGE
ncbi:MAG TPA: hypothetical protein PK438_01875 [Clostridia bacterium]|nr:MAG: hypothetical protein BWY35_01622 [Firmicutes bacterium ADurb.Bin248]HOG00513.1 hypothetical protein [Clostridia bacterium]HOS18009.1 hypothetical protein [Clostridia bacterium]HPK14817.1 hypothetical protein [Clostridia bacterium]